tara:strand:- start:203 stop:436 length:234 start_codon:yes stop_codon:yes gene_type:complete
MIPRTLAETKLKTFIELSKFRIFKSKILMVIKKIGKEIIVANDIEQKANSIEELSFSLFTQLAEKAYKIDAKIIKKK